ncbi:MAG: NUDIX hydrolase [Ferrovum sp.]|nr:NUDIX hydrolase [Ferrovum sp.]NDU87306.1 NUDIX hydrolase [Ferrovum sp.]
MQDFPEENLPDFSETCIDSVVRYQGSLLHVYEDRVTLPDGKEARREYIKHNGAAAIIPLLDDGTVLLEYQFRYPQRRHYFEIPAGKLDVGEDPFTAAQRELQEETGYRATRWQRLMCLDLCIAYSTEQITYFLARDLIYEAPDRDEEEFLETLAVPLIEAWRWIEEGRINDAKTVAGLLWLKGMGSHLKLA